MGLVTYSGAMSVTYIKVRFPRTYSYGGDRWTEMLPTEMNAYVQ